MGITKNNGGGNGQGRNKIAFFELRTRFTDHLTPAERERNPLRADCGFAFHKDADGNPTLYQKGVKTPRQNAIERSLTGTVVDVRVGEDSYPATPNEKFPVCSIRLADGDGVDEVINFRLDQSLGRRLIGLLMTSEMMQDAQGKYYDAEGNADPRQGPSMELDIYAGVIEAGHTFPDGKVQEKDEPFLNVKPSGASVANKISQLHYLNMEGKVLTFPGENGKVSAYPMATKHVISGKTHWDFGPQTEIAVSTAKILEAHFKNKPAHVNTEEQARSAELADGDGIDLNEAAALASAPRG